MRKTIEFIRTYWGLGKEIVLVLAAIFYFALGLRIAPLVTRADATDERIERLETSLNTFVISSEKRFNTNENTLKQLSDSYLVSRNDIKWIKESLDKLLLK